MSNTFNTTKLAGSRVLVQGSDEGESMILDSSQYDELAARTSLKEAEAAFSDAIKEIFAPLTEAAEKAEAIAKLAREVTDPAFSIELEPAVKGVQERPAVVVHLDHDTVILRMIASGDTSRLIWVDGCIEIVAA